MLHELEKTIQGLTMVDGDDHLRVVARGKRTRESIVSIAEEIIDRCAQNGVDTVLVDVRELRGRLSVFDSLTVVRDDFAKLNPLGVLKRAGILDRLENRFRLRFFESVARRRGYNLRTFVDPEQANLWLRERDNSPDN